jgi:ferredoxin-NADP reductase
MAGTALRRRLTWQLGTVVGEQAETPRTRRIALDLGSWDGHLPGQHVDVRLTAGDGYQAQRSYSIASAPESATVDLVVERLDGGEVSPYLVEKVRVGDQLELRGPIGGYFVWHRDLGGPLQLIAGGSGVAPFLAMLDHHAAAAPHVPARLLYSARTLEDVIARDHLDEIAVGGVGITVALTRAQPPGWTGLAGRVTREVLSETVWPPRERPQVFVCGPTGFVEAVADSLVALGHPAHTVKTERFGGQET